MNIPYELKAINDSIFIHLGLEISNIKLQEESKEYSAYEFTINNKSILFRIAKITPKKVGQFVTLWKRSLHDNKIYPYHFNDDISLVIINVNNGQKSGQFIFSKEVLCKKYIFSSDKKEGKRAIRVYPFWDAPTSTQAKNTQKWQSNYFLNLSEDIDLNLAKNLYADLF